MRNAPKKAKLAHDKRRQETKKKDQVGPYTFPRVLEYVEMDGERWALVDLDGHEDLGLVDPGFTRLNGHGDPIPGALACPAVYCATSGARARSRYATYASQTP